MKEIKDLISKRYLLLERNEDEECPEEMKIIDNIALEVINKLFENRDNLPVDFILESLTDLGFSPCLIFDDDGHWAVDCNGISTVKSQGVSMINNVSEKLFKESIREAIKHFLKILKEGS